MLRQIVNANWLIWIGLAGPLVWLTIAWSTESLFYGELIHISGELSARLLMLTMAITPFAQMFPRAHWPRWLLIRRRYFGVATFVYAMLHAIIYVDRKRSLDLILEEGSDFSMWTGWLALILFLALAVTSNDASVRWLKRAWKKVHRLVYPAALLTFVHWIFVAFDFVPGLVHFSILVALELYRVASSRTSRSQET